MTLENVQYVIRDRIPDILSLGDYEDRMRKCLEILKTTHFDNDRFYVKQESDDVVEMLDMFLVENEAYGYLKESNYSAFEEANIIRDICRTCLYENKFWREIPLNLSCYVRYGHKIDILGITIGDYLQDARSCLDAYKLVYNYEPDNNYIDVENKLISKNKDVRLKLKILLEDNRVNGFVLLSGSSTKRWKVLSVIDDFFADCRYKMEKISESSIIQVYDSYYEIAKVYSGDNETHIRVVSSKQHEKETKPWWKR